MPRAGALPSGLGSRSIASRRSGKRRGAICKVEGRQIAFLQYTSGSTSLPKGVDAQPRTDPLQRLADSTGVSHDDRKPRRLLAAVVPRHGAHRRRGPADLLRRFIDPAWPRRPSCSGRPCGWRRFRETRATISGGPDFAYDLCARKISAEERGKAGPEQLAGGLPGGGADPPADHRAVCRASSLPADSAARRCSPAMGWPKRRSWCRAARGRRRPIILHVKAEALARNRVEVGSAEDTAHRRTLVGCGETLRGQRVLIVDPQTRLTVADGQVGEIWVQGPSVARGYYENPQATAATFQARLADSGEGPFLRTGDLGFVHQGQFFVTGRLKNLIIIRGRNHYPEDIEQTVNAAYEGLRVGYCAAFSIEVDDRGPLGGRPGSRTAATRPGHRRGDAGHPHGDRRPARTGSPCGRPGQGGRRSPRPPAARRGGRRAANAICAGELEILAAWKAPRTSRWTNVPEEAPVAGNPRQVPAEEIEAWLIERITARLRLAPGDVEVTTPFLEFGMGSLDAVEIAAELERWLGRHVVAHGDLQLSHDRGLGAVAGQPCRERGGRATPRRRRFMFAPRRLEIPSSCWRKSAA